MCNKIRKDQRTGKHGNVQSEIIFVPARGDAGVRGEAGGARRGGPPTPQRCYRTRAVHSGSLLGVGCGASADARAVPGGVGVGAAHWCPCGRAPGSTGNPHGSVREPAHLGVTDMHTHTGVPTCPSGTPVPTSHSSAGVHRLDHAACGPDPCGAHRGLTSCRWQLSIAEDLQLHFRCPASPLSVAGECAVSVISSCSWLAAEGPTRQNLLVNFLW